MKTRDTKDFNVGILGAIIGATVAVAFLNKDNRKKVVDSFGDSVVQDVKKQALNMWDEFKKKGDMLLEQSSSLKKNR